MIASWSAPGAARSEYAFAIDRGRNNRLLIVPALFDEGHTMRAMVVRMMRHLDKADIDSFLIDLPGTNESLAPLSEENVDSWNRATMRAADHFAVTSALGIRGGAMFLPPMLRGWMYAPVRGAAVLNRLARARAIASREAGREETVGDILEAAARDGAILGGYHFGAQMIRDLADCPIPERPLLGTFEQETIGGSGMWLRAEPGDDPNQAEALASLLYLGLKT